MDVHRLDQIAVLDLLTTLEELGAKDRSRTEELTDLIKENHAINMAQALGTLYPSHSREKAQTVFRQFRKRLAFAAEAAEQLFELQVDSNKRSDPAERLCWFIGPDPTEQRLTNYNKNEIECVFDEENRVPQSGIELKNGKPLIQFFISYSH